LAKVPTNEQDSILSTNRSKFGQDNVEESGNTKDEMTRIGAANPNNQKKYFQKGGRVRSRSNAPIGSLLTPATHVGKTARGTRDRHRDALKIPQNQT